MSEPLYLREDARRDIVTRLFEVRSQTVNEEERSVEAVISTDSPVEVWDWRRGEVIDEILLAPAAQLPQQMPMLANHDRWSLDSVLGSIRGLRVDGGSIIGRLMFAKDDVDADKAWNKVRQAHIKDVSVGYRVNEAVEIAPGQTAVVAGCSFTAGKRALRIATNWTPKEGSLVPIGADQSAKIREDNLLNITNRKEGSNVNPELRKFLESLGLRKEATEAEAKTYYENLKPDDKARADGSVALVGATPSTPPSAEPTRSMAATDTQTVGPAEIAANAIAAERNRIRQIRELAGQDVPTDITTRAIDEGWDINRASSEFLASLRSSRGQAAGPAIHVHGRERDTNVRTLAAGMLIGQGLDPVRCRSFNGQVESTRFTEEEADRGYRYRSMSAPDLFRECLRLDTGRSYSTIEEAFDAARSAPSGGTLSYVFSTNVYARLMAGWDEVADTTSWCDEEDVANFLEQEDITLEASARLQRLGRGDTAKDATVSDKHETYKIARFAKKFAVDEQDVIDDRLGAIMRMPQELGSAARRLRPDLVYSLMLANAALVSTGGTLFNATAVSTAGGHANYASGSTTALSAASLTAAINAMGTQRRGGVVLNIKPRFLIVPQALAGTGKEILTSTALAKVGGNTTTETYMPINILAGENMTLVIDDRIGAVGVVDPTTEATRTGTATNWFLSAGGPRTVRVAYRRGTGRSPQLRSYVLDKGQWGIGWDINMDIGAKAMDYVGLYKSAGA